jgi:glycerol-3-phosphate cytidylyltransferase
MTTVITYGTFDLFHVGHLNLFRNLKSIGDRLIVAVSTDEFNDIKGKRAIIPFVNRVEIVKAIRFVDLVVPETSWDQKISDIKKHNVDVFAIGEDWTGKFDHLSDHCRVIYLPRTHGISSTDLRQALAPLRRDRIDELRSAIDILSRVVEDLD